MKLNIHSQTYTLVAGASTPLIPLVGNCVLLTSDSSTDYTTDIALKIDDSGFRKIATGTKIKMPGEEVFSSVQLKNTGAGSQTFHVLVLMGDAANYNMTLNGDITVGTVTIDDSTPLKVEQQTSIEIDDTTPVKVEQQTSVDVIQSAAIIALLTRIADATEGTEINTTP